MNFVGGISKSKTKNQRLSFKTQAIKKFKEIKVVVRKSQEKLIRNTPEILSQLYQQAKKIKNKFSKSKLTTRKTYLANKKGDMLSRENADISKRTLMKRKIERGNEVKSVIQTKVTTKIESLAKIPTKEMKRKEFELMKKENKKPQTRSIEHLAPSTPELENRSIGSIFADTVTSALAQCGKEDKILNKYSDSCEKFPNCLAADEEFKKIIEMAQDVKDKMKSAEITVKSQNDNDFRMEDGTLRTLNLLLTVDKNVEKSSEDQWNCQLTGVLEKKSGEEHNSSSLSVSSYENEGRCLHVTEQGGGQKTDTQIHEKDIEEGKQMNLIIKKEITKEIESVVNKELTDTTACQCNTTKTEISSANERKERNLKNTEDILKEVMQTHENNTEEVHEKITIIKNNEEVILNTPIREDKSKSDNFEDFIKSGLQREDEKVEGSTLPAPVSSETQGIEEEDSNKKRKLKKMLETRNLVINL
ncbi:hypothetical protein HHI36_010169 [Cryptolaemus montrouzieri]|uniref:Uncharacterized protein n=1 Tax=Cryptolaemus montrouzieri TaxID=559131 RepID=A0ABD2MI17_9CUCU